MPQGPDLPEGQLVEGQNPNIVVVDGTVVITYVNDTNVTPTVPGNYNPDGFAGLYCTVQDVFAAGLGVRWEELQAEIERYMVMAGTDSQSLMDWITNTVIPDVESEVDQLLGMTYKPTRFTKLFDGNGRTEFYLPYYPVTEVDHVTIYAYTGTPIVRFTSDVIGFTESLGTMAQEPYTQTKNLMVETDTGRMYIPPKAINSVGFPLWTWDFTQGVMNVEAAWTTGFTSPSVVPRAFRNAVASLCVIRCLELTGMIENRGLAAHKVGDASSTVGREKNLPYSDLIDRLEKKAKRSLVPFKRVG